jgi:very-short-patch-repair endonuclease
VPGRHLVAVLSTVDDVQEESQTGVGVDLGAFFSSGGGWGEPWVLDVSLIESLRFGPPEGHTDLDVAIALTRLLYDDLVSYGTDGRGRRLNNDTVPVVIKAHRVVIERLALIPPAWPFRAFDGPRGFGAYWRDNGMSGSWQARRDCVEEILGPTRDALEELQELEYESRFRNGPSGSFKNLIFAAVGEKPEMVLRDAVNNDVEIVRNAHTCLVFTDPLPPQGLTWRQMVAWWTKNHQAGADEKAAASGLYRRLYRSLDSVPEQLVMRTYCARYAEEDGFDLPVLIPQVYLHYDPYTRRSGKQSGALPRQRMDFLLLAPDRSRIVIEVDGVQHYGQPNPPDEKGRITHTAVPRLYAEMVAEDRRLRLAGYEIYRFGGWELTGPDGKQLLESFFTELLARHQKPTP